ncbi:MAG: lipid-binding protein [Flavobacteriales bacterium]
MKYVKNILASLVITVFVISCDKGGDPDPGGTAVEQMAGDWYVKYLVNGVDVGNGYNLLSTYNTSANVSTEMWVDNHNLSLSPLKVKANSNIGNLTFSGTDLENIAGINLTTTIHEGKVLKNVATTSGGNTSDSIYFQFESITNPGVIYVVGGYKRTGFAEDEH